MAGVLDAAIHMDAASTARVTLNGGVRVDDVELRGIVSDAEIVPGHHGDHGKHCAGRFPALGAAAGVVVRHVALDRDGDRICGALARERAALELLGTGLDALVDRWMKLDCHETL